ncbi:DNA methylase [Actinobacillus pleuropneumoniae]|nr:DNA methylase [Actinobacillus pleuropneumoniae]
MQEIFQINQPDLDFGIYRILNSRQNEIQQFLTRTLPNNINGAFNGNFEQANSVYNHLYTFFSRYYDQAILSANAATKAIPTLFLTQVKK